VVNLDSLNELSSYLELNPLHIYEAGFNDDPPYLRKGGTRGRFLAPQHIRGVGGSIQNLRSIEPGLV
jgi:hypothetical protein